MNIYSDRDTNVEIESDVKVEATDQFPCEYCGKVCDSKHDLNNLFYMSLKNLPNLEFIDPLVVPLMEYLLMVVPLMRSVNNIVSVVRFKLD